MTWLLVILSYLGGCDNKEEVDFGPCKFPPADSRFPNRELAYCDDCSFQINFRGEQYLFNGKQFKTVSGTTWNPPDKNILTWLTRNSFFEFYLVAPESDELLVNSIGSKTRILKVDTMFQLNSPPPPVSVSFRMYNYCRDFFEPLNESINQSHHQLTKVEPVKSYPVLINSMPYQLHGFYCEGEIQATFLIDNAPEAVTARYKLWIVVYEKL